MFKNRYYFIYLFFKQNKRVEVFILNRSYYSDKLFLYHNYFFNKSITNSI